MCQTSEHEHAILAPPAWHERETLRFTSGYYLPVPVTVSYAPYPAEHFLHLSTTATEQDFIAYTPSDTYGQADRQVRLKFGRYLKKFFPAMADASVQAYVTELKLALAIAENPATLHFTTDCETISKIFETRMCASGSSCESCMYDKFTYLKTRPYHVYADSPDVAVAYVTSGPDSDIVSRSVVSIKDKEWVRAYSRYDGDNDADCGTLKELLKQAGYTKGDLIGNRLTKLPDHLGRNGKPMLPYIDNGGAHVRDEGKYWEVVEDGEGDWEADCTDGSATRSGSRCSECDERIDDCECSTCDCCGDRSPHGCDDCSMCERCGGCETHDGCDCERCPNCHNYMPNGRRTRNVSTCDCERCSECNKLDDDCECDKCSECGELDVNCECEPKTEIESEPAESEPAPVDATMLALADSDAYDRNMCMTNREIRHKLNRIFVYIRDSRGGNAVHSEYSLLWSIFSSIPYLQENV